MRDRASPVIVDWSTASRSKGQPTPGPWCSSKYWVYLAVHPGRPKIMLCLFEVLITLRAQCRSRAMPV